ncbi:hypothetical protein Tco_0089705 [Tanacetum coccineum]
MVNTRTDAELAAAVQAAVDAMLPQIREQVREEYRTGAVASGSNPPPVTIHTWLERFNKQKPRSFEKAVAPVDAENWISHMEKIFDVMDCNDAFKTRLAVYKFEGDALAWWKAYKQAKGGDESRNPPNNGKLVCTVITKDLTLIGSLSFRLRASATTLALPGCFPHVSSVVERHMLSPFPSASEQLQNLCVTHRSTQRTKFSVPSGS